MATDLGNRIRDARRAAGFDNAESLAVALGVGYRTVQRWESGRNAPSVQRLNLIAQATGKPLSFFFAADGVAA